MPLLSAPSGARAARLPWGFLLSALLGVALAVLGYKVWLIAQHAREVRADVQALAAMADERPATEALAKAGPLLTRARASTAALRAEAAPLLPLAPLLGGVPAYGPTLAAAEPLLDLGVALTVAADEGYAALAPLALARQNAEPPGPRLVAGLAGEQERLERARNALGRANELYAQLPVDALAPSVRAPLERVGLRLPDALDALDIARALPELLGGAGRREYLVYAQNPDELRPTGGFISAAGTVVLENGRIERLDLRDSPLLDDPTRFVYPYPPDALRRYMGFELWLLRDSNWSPDFPTAAQKGIELFAISQGREVDGVVAVNPEALRLLLQVTGPVSVDGTTVSAENVVDFIRAGGNAGLQAADDGSWVKRRKAFLPGLGAALVARVSDPARTNLAALAAGLDRAFDERQLQLYVRQPLAAGVLARRGWDGGVRADGRDFLMVVDANLGYNKINALIEQTMAYRVDLTASEVPTASLMIRYANPLPATMPCDQWLGERIARNILSYADWMTGCYWNYSRVLRPQGTELISSTAHPTPGEWMVTAESESGQARVEDAEAGASVTGAFFVVPLGGAVERRLAYKLPPSVLAREGEGWCYRLLIQKQSGSAGIPVTVQVTLPPGARPYAVSPPAGSRSGSVFVFPLELTRDRQIELCYDGKPAP